MKAMLQLEFDLWQQLTAGQQSPDDVNWQQLCLAFDAQMEDTPIEQRLATAADAITQMTDLFVARADEVFSSWQRILNDGPIVTEDLFAEFVRQSFQLDLEGLVGVPEVYVRSTSDKFDGETETLVEYREKDKILADLASFAEEDPERAIETLEHDEDVQVWIKTVTDWFQNRSGAVRVLELFEEMELSRVKVWLALLLGGFELQQLKGFYELEGLIITEPPIPLSG